MLWMILLSPAMASDFVDVWVTSALEDDNILAGPADYSPSLNFVERGNSTFFENYESKYTQDISQTHLVLYRKDEGLTKHFTTEAAMAVRFAPYINPSQSKSSTNVQDDGSYVRLIYQFGEKKERNLALTGYAVDADRMRLGYSYDLTWGGKDIFVTDPGVAPGARLQLQYDKFYAYAGIKTAIADYVDPVTDLSRNQTYYGGLVALGGELGDNVRLEGGAGSFQQGQLLAEATAQSSLYGSMIQALGVSGQLSVRSTTKMDYIISNELKLYRNAPEFLKDTYITHPHVDGVGFLVQAEGNYLMHNLLDADTTDSTVVEHAFAGDVQAVLRAGNTEIGADFVYKDLAYIVFDVPGLTSDVAIGDSVKTSPQVYGRAKISHYFDKAHVTPALGVGIMQPAAYQAQSSVGASNYYVVRDARNFDAVPDGQLPSALLSAVASAQWDFSKSTVGVVQVLYTLNNNKSDFVATDGETGGYVPSAPNFRNELGLNLMMRARF